MCLMRVVHFRVVGGSANAKFNMDRVSIIELVVMNPQLSRVVRLETRSLSKVGVA